MVIALGSDHRGFLLKEKLKKVLLKSGYTVIDKGCFNNKNKTDYPDFGLVVCEAVVKKKADRGILICGTGIGMSIVANKVPGIRAALVTSLDNARKASQHNLANVLCLGEKTSYRKATIFIKTWLNTPFLGGRHKRRINKITRIEKRYCNR